MADLALDIPMDVEGFLDWEGQQEERYELVAGIVRMMPGGTSNHDLVATNAAGELRARLRGSRCRVHGANLKVRSPSRAIMYPDSFVRCGPNVGTDQVADDPVLVVEVLSASTAQHDMTRKRWAYQAIPSLQVILFVDPNRVWVEQFTREPDGGWLSRIVEDQAASLPIPALEIELPMTELYLDVDLRAEEPTALDG